MITISRVIHTAPDGRTRWTWPHIAVRINHRHCPILPFGHRAAMRATERRSIRTVRIDGQYAVVRPGDTLVIGIDSEPRQVRAFARQLEQAMPGVRIAVVPGTVTVQHGQPADSEAVRSALDKAEAQVRIGRRR